MNDSLKPTKSYVTVSWAAMIISVGSYLIGLFNSSLQLNEKGFYLMGLVMGVYSVITLQKTIRDQAEGIKVTAMYKNLNIVCLMIACLAVGIGLFNVDTLLLNEKGFFAIAYCMSLFAAIVTQKNVRDLAVFEDGFMSNFYDESQQAKVLRHQNVVSGDSKSEKDS